MGLQIYFLVLSTIFFLSEVCVAYQNSYQFQQQVVLIIDDDTVVHKIGRLFYEQHDTTSRVLVWNDMLQEFQLGSWNANFEKYEDQDVEQELPIGSQEPLKWFHTIVKVVGKENRTTLSGFFAEDLATVIAEELADYDIRQIDILGCTKLACSESDSQEDPSYLQSFMLQLKKYAKLHTNVTIQFNIVFFDHSGSLLTGQFHFSPKSAIKWSHSNYRIGSQLDAWKGTFIGNSYHLKHLKAYGDYSSLYPPFFGIIPREEKVYISDFQQKQPVSIVYTDETTFKWLDVIAQETYENSPKCRAPYIPRKVRLFSKHETTIIHVIEIQGISDLLSEIHYYGETGPGKNTQVHYRFGNFVISMNEATFDVAIAGTIAAFTNSSSLALLVNITELSHEISNMYPMVQPRTGKYFFKDVVNWINGANSDIGFESANAFTALCGVSMFLSESIRSFHIHMINMMALDLANHGYLTKLYFFSSHPMAHRDTWEIKDTKTGEKLTGLKLLRNFEARNGLLKDERMQKTFNEVIQRSAMFSKTWLSHIDNNKIMGSRYLPPATKLSFDTDNKNEILSSFSRIGSTNPDLCKYLRDFELQESVYTLISSKLSEPEIGAVETRTKELSYINELTLSLQVSLFLIGDHKYVCDMLRKALQRKEQETGKKYQIVPYSTHIDKQNYIVKFFVQEVLNSSSLEETIVYLDESSLQSELFLSFLISIYQNNSVISIGIGLKNAVGIYNSIQLLQSNNWKDGMFNIGKNLYKIGDITGINKAATEVLGRMLKPISEKITSHLFGKSNRFMKPGNKIGDFIGKIGIGGIMMKIFSAVIGAYNIYEDFSKETTIGYIDGLLDIVTEVTSVLGLEAAPIETALSLIKAGVDYFYTDISREIDALPSDASVGEIAIAVVNGILKGVADIFHFVFHNLNILAALQDIDALEDQYEKDQRLLQKISDDQYYYCIEGLNSSVIDFARGEVAWNGGDITFHLGENGYSSLTLPKGTQKIKTKGVQPKGTQKIKTKGVQNIILGVGENHLFIQHTYTVHAFFFIPVYSKELIQQVVGEKETLHGTYYGNSQNNKFFTIQYLPEEANLDYSLYDYHYTLYGNGGNDTFYLGPEPTYVEGNEGSDAYFINSSFKSTVINSYSADGLYDTMIINLEYYQLSSNRVGLNLSLTSSNAQKIVIVDWFLDVTHQKMIFKTGDGVLFRISATITEEVEMIAYALSGSRATKPLVYDARRPEFLEVVVITGSEYNDTLIGNDLDNQINGAEGNDHLFGGEGKDTYTIDLNTGVDTIDNFATDGQVDILVFRANLDELSFIGYDDGSNNLYILHDVSNNISIEDIHENLDTGAIILDWYLNDSYRHLIVVTEDKNMIKVSSIKNSTFSYHLIILNMSNVESQDLPGEPYTRLVNLSSSQDYVDVITVLGTNDNDKIIGNSKDNYITAARGFDYLEGREGADTYIIKEQGTKIIINCANDNEIDMLLFDVKFDDIEMEKISELDLKLYSSEDHLMMVILKNWYLGSTCQHLLVRSIDGITFDLPIQNQELDKTAKAIDYSNMTSDIQIVLNGTWKSVERVTGSQGYDDIIGNSLDNYIDPGRGNSSLEGGNGSDIYIIHSTYGKENTINNYAEDDLMDTILFMVPFLSIHTEVIGNDIHLTSLSDDGQVGITIKNYCSQSTNYFQHLVITTVDGISFILPIGINGNCEPTPISINVVHVNTGQHIDLTAYPYFNDVNSVYGSAKYQNYIVGNNKNNTFVGGSKSDFLRGNHGDDILKGEDGDDVLDGGPGSDTLVGGDGDDTINGGEDHDIISPGSGANRIDGGLGTDTIIYSGYAFGYGINLDLSIGYCIHDGEIQDSLMNIENAYGTEYDDILLGDDNDNILVGQGGHDYLSPGAGYDILSGRNGNDTYNLTTANGTVIIENFADDEAWDVAIIGYTNLSNIWYEIIGHDVVLRVINDQYPVFYDGEKPAVIFKNFTTHFKYQHINIEMADGSSTELYEFINPKIPPTLSTSTQSTSMQKPNSGIYRSFTKEQLCSILTLLLIVLLPIFCCCAYCYKNRDM